MTDLQGLLIQQLDVCLAQDAWQVSLRRALQDLSAQDAAWRADDATHSVWQLVRHLAYWNDRWLDRFLGRPTKPGLPSNDATFEAIDPVDAEIPAAEAAWEREVARLEESLSSWREAVLSPDEARLEEPYSAKDSSPRWTVVSCLVMHNQYHIGQMVDVRKRQRSWTPANL